MRSTTLYLTDSVNTPILVTDNDGKVIYKNHCAKKCIKSPRLNASINKHINKKACVLSTPSGTVKISTIVNNNSAHKRAFVCRIIQNKNIYYIWIFASSLQIPETEDFDQLHLQKLEGFLKDAFDSLQALDFYANKSSIERYSKISSPFFEAMQYLKYSDNNNEKFKTYRILNSLKEKTLELAKLYNVRIDIDTESVDNTNFYHLPFKSFSSLYIQVLLILLKISSYAPVRIKCSQQAEVFTFELEAAIKPMKSIQNCGFMLFEIASVFPDEYFNIIFIEQFAILKGYKTKYQLTKRDQKLYLTLSFTTSLEETSLVVQDDNIVAANMYFAQLEQTIFAYMDALFKIL